MASIRVKCTSCGTKLKAQADFAGKKMKCPKCKELLLVPVPANSPDESIETMAANLLAGVRDTPSRTSNTVPSREIIGGIEFVCPFCEEAYQVAQEMAGRSILCRNCGASSKVPEFVESDEFDFMRELKGEKPAESLTSIMSVRGIPKPLMKQFKAWCNAHEITMKDKIIEMIRECIQEEN